MDGSSVPAPPSRSLVLPLVLVIVAVLMMLSFQTVTLWQEREALTVRYAKQEPALQQSQQMRAQLDSIARKTADLADQGNTNAALLVETLQQRGITINRSGKSEISAEEAAP